MTQKTSGHPDPEPERLAEYLVTELAPTVIPALRRKFGFAIPDDELPGVIDEAAVRVDMQCAESEGSDDWDPRRLRRLFYGVCRIVALEIIRTGWNQQRLRERGLAVEGLDKVASGAALGDGEAHDATPLTRTQQLIRKAVRSLSARDQIILSYLCSRDGKFPTAELAAKWQIGKKAVRREKHHALRRLKKALLRIAPEGSFEGDETLPRDEEPLRKSARP